MEVTPLRRFSTSIMEDEVLEALPGGRRRHRRMDLASADLPYPWLEETKLFTKLADLPAKKKYEPKGFMAEVAPRLSPAEEVCKDGSPRVGRSQVPPVIRCQCNGVEAKALLNSACTISTISKIFVSQIRANNDVLSDVGGVSNPLRSPMPHIEGRLQLVELRLGSFQQILQLYVVTESPADLGLGVDFLRKTHGIVNFQDGCLILGGSGGQRVPFMTNGELSAMVKPAL